MSYVELKYLKAECWLPGVREGPGFYLQGWGKCSKIRKLQGCECLKCHWMIHFNTVACVRAKSLQSCSTLCDPVAHQGPLSMVSSRQEYWSGLSCPPPEDLLDPEIKPKFPATPALQADSLPLGHLGRLIQPLIVWFWASNSPFLIFSFLFYKPSTIIIINLMSLI